LLIAVYGDDASPEQSSSLSVLLSKLRAVVGTVVLAGRSELELVLAPDAFVDVEAAFEGIHRAPKGVMLDTDVSIAEHGREIYLQAGRSHAMPPANVTAITPEVSMNFGHRNGWSYISGGFFGRSKLYVDRADAPATGAPYRNTLHYGGGARWFTSDHLAFSVDFRWYSVDEQLAAPGVTAQPRTTLLVLSGGVSFK